MEIMPKSESTDLIILSDVKTLIGIEPEETHFDDELVIHINNAISELFMSGVLDIQTVIEKDSTWSVISSIPGVITSLKLVIGMKVRLVFDPPTNSFLVESLTKVVNKLEYNLGILYDKEEKE